MVYKEPRHKIEIFAFVFLVFICFISNNGLWKLWAVPTISVGIIYILDIMFSQSRFDYEPDYAYWKEKNDNADY